MDNVEHSLNSPPDSIPSRPPVETREQLLPFGHLTWENFEKLCYKIASKGNFPFASRYGRPGQLQHGIDIFVRLQNGKYRVWQVKRKESLQPAELKSIIAEFRAGEWFDKTEELILSVKCSIANTKLQDLIETEAQGLKKDGIVFVTYGGEKLSEILKELPEVVDDFFGREWARVFLGQEAADRLGARLDGEQFSRVRTQLKSYYNASFHLLDLRNVFPGFLDTTYELPNLLRRFTTIDVLEKVRVESQFPSESFSGEHREKNSADQKAPGRIEPTKREYVRKTALINWIGETSNFVLFGDPGSGKSNLLRSLTLDILFGTRLFPTAAERWGALLPIHVSFARWCRLSDSLGRAANLKEIVEEVLQPNLTVDMLALLNNAIDDRRVLLLIDGIDEWSNEQAARTSLQQIMAYVKTHAIPAVITARKSGLDKIGNIPPAWRVAEIANLSLVQQKQLAMDLLESASPDESNKDNLPRKVFLDKVFSELSQNSKLSALAANPLFLVILITLSVQQQMLPKYRTLIIQSLVESLIGSRPTQRATEAGEVHSRFSGIQSAEELNAVLGKLAFIMRSSNAGGSISLTSARQVLQDFLSIAPFSLSANQAKSAVAELLAVNSETIGVLSQPTPSDVQFAHALFEEFLAAQHILTWPFAEIKSFVCDRAGDPRWREVVINLITLLNGQNGVESLINSIESVLLEDPLASANREILLSDIAFKCPIEADTTKIRLAKRSLSVIERGDWLALRGNLLRTALTAVDDAQLLDLVNNKLNAWAPARVIFRAAVFKAFEDWAPSEELYEVLLSGLCAEERYVQKCAARTLAKLYANDSKVQTDLQTILRSPNLSQVAAALEALTIGWCHTPGLAEFFDKATDSTHPTLKFVGVSGRVKLGRADLKDRDLLLGLLSRISSLDFADKKSARDFLSCSWPDDPVIISKALTAVRRHGRLSANDIESETANHYLLHCSTSNENVLKFVRDELMDEDPFISLLGRSEVWDCLIPFVQQHSDIKDLVIAHIKSESSGAFLHYYPKLIAAIRGDELRDFLINLARSENRWLDYWVFRILLDSWGRTDQTVSTFLDEVAESADTRINHIAALLPEILQDRKIVRARLFALWNTEKPQFNSIARGFVAIGCDSADSEVVELLLKESGTGIRFYDPEQELLSHFSSHPDVREFAIRTLSRRNPPVEIIAKVYKDDPEIRSIVLRLANALPTTLRSELAETASNLGANRHSCRRLLEEYDIEIDADLKINSSIFYHKLLAESNSSTNSSRLDVLTNDVQAIGPDHPERRAAAFAGLLLLGKGQAVKNMTWTDKPLSVSTGAHYGKENGLLMALMVEKWEELQSIFENNFVSRFGDLGSSEEHLWECFAPYLSGSATARRDFLSYCERTPTILGSQGLTALANELPRTNILLNHCLRLFEYRGHHVHHNPWDIERGRIEAAYILREQFLEEESAISTTRKYFTQVESSAAIVALCITSPQDDLLNQIKYTPLEVGEKCRDWVAAVHLAALRTKLPNDFTQVVYSMLNRGVHRIWDFQQFANRAVIERVMNDTDSADLFAKHLMEHPTKSEAASLPQYLFSAGKLTSKISDRCAYLLAEELKKTIPSAAFDAITDSTRSLAQSLMETCAPSLQF